MRAAFFGTPAAAIPALCSLADAATVATVVTRPDRPRGRSGRPGPSAVKRAAQEFGFPVLAPERAEEALDAVAGCDVAVVVAYGQILPERLLAAVPAGFVNVHFSLLPRWRGAAPVAHAILAGDDATGVSLMRLDAGLDTGPVFDQVRIPLRGNERRGPLTARLAAVGAELLGRTLAPIVSGAAVARRQDGAAATSAPKLRVADARLDPATGTEAVYRRVRAFHPAPGAWGMVEGRRFKVLDAAPLPDVAAPGRLASHEGRLLLGTGEGALELVTVQPEGRRPMSGSDWLAGRRGTSATLE